jgi:sugar-specific transcriptional regulator TrmB
MEIKELLGQFGLQNKEDEVYLACLQLGTAPAQEIAKKAGIKRTTAYDVLKNLINKGLISQTQKGSKKLFIAEPPEKLGELLEEKQSKLMEALPLLNSFYNTAGTKTI